MYGVRQGSSLGLLLFHIYIDVCEYTNLFCSGKDSETTEVR